MDLENTSKPLIIRAAVASVLSASFLLPMAGINIGLGFQGIIAAMVQIFCAWPIYMEAFRKRKDWNTNEDLLVGSAILAAYFYTFYQIYIGIPSHFHFWLSSFLITFVLIGKILEEKSSEKANSDLKALCNLEKETVRIKVDDEFVSVPIQVAKRGDLFEILPGENIPIDGQVIEGSSAVDESMLTREQFVSEKIPGSLVFAGTLNKHGTIIALATNVGKSTALSRIIEMAKNACSTQTSMEKKISKISPFFIPAVFVVAILSWVLGRGPNGMSNAIAVLIIASPKALRLAIPIALQITFSKAARLGIFIKDAAVIEKAHKMKEILIEKKNAVTEGMLNVDKCDIDAKYFPILNNLAKHLDHPASEAMVQYINQQHVPFLPSMLSFRSIPRAGVSGHFDGRRYFFGLPRFLEEHQIEVETLQKTLYQEKGQVLALGTEKQALGYFVFSDRIKAGSAEALAELKRFGIKTTLMTEDRRSFAKELAEQLGFDFFEAEVLENDKIELVRKAQREKRIVGMVGDGEGDAKALALADVGFAISEGIDIAMESAGVGLMYSHLRGVVQTIQLSKNAYKKMVQNIFFASSLNSIGITLGAFGYLNPAVAVFFGAFSTYAIYRNALAKIFFKFEK